MASIFDQAGQFFSGPRKPPGAPPVTLGQNGTGPGWRGAAGAKANAWINKSAAPAGTGAPPPAMGGGGPKQGGMVPDAPPVDPANPTGAPPTGTESGAGILENWFNQRATGTDPAYEYSLKRGGDAIDTRMAAGGSFNSGARGQQQSDFAANMGAQRQGQLDALAGGASGEHRGRLQDMFGVAGNLAGGQAGLAGAYDITAANGMSAADNAILQMILNKAGVDPKADQGFLNNLFSIFSLGAKK